MEKMKSLFRNTCIAATGAALTSPAFAAIDMTEVESKITAATGQGEEAGGWVIVAVVSLAVVGLIIAVVRKI